MLAVTGGRFSTEGGRPFDNHRGADPERVSRRGGDS